MSTQPKIAQFIEQRQNLPIAQIKDQFLEAFKNHNVIILTGSTGSGKTTQVPQYILDAKLSSRIVVTQPRRVAATSLAKRICAEAGSELGEDVGYAVRFNKVTSPNTKILVATDGTILKELCHDPLLSRFDTIILDEVHTRSLNTDLLLGVIKDALTKRSDLHVVIMSATLLPSKFEAFFPGSCHIAVPSSSHEVAIQYREPTENLIEAAVTEIIDIAKNGPKDLPFSDEFIASNILVFFSGEEEIRETEELLKLRLETENLGTPLEILKVYGAMKDSEQAKIFTKTPDFTRRVILATNIAETSITIPNIVYVIDCGFHKIKIFDPNSMKSCLARWPASKSNLAQRAGRAGRIAPGMAIRLFPEEIFEKLPDETEPEILRCDTTNLILTLLSINKNPFSFDFIDFPKTFSLKKSFKLLKMNALIKDQKLTKKGRFCAELPLNFSESLALYRAAELRVLDEVAKIVAVLTNPDIFEKTLNFKDFSAKLRTFRVKNSEHLSILKIVENFLIVSQSENEAEMKKWCHEYSLKFSFFSGISALISQILKIVEKFKIAEDPNFAKYSRDERILRAIMCGFSTNFAVKIIEKKDNLNSEYYVNLGSNSKVSLASSPFFTTEKPDYVVFSEIFCTVNRNEMKFASAIDAKSYYEELPEIYRFWSQKNPQKIVRTKLRDAVFDSEPKSRRD